MRIQFWIAGGRARHLPTRGIAVFRRRKDGYYLNIIIVKGLLRFGRKLYYSGAVTELCVSSIRDTIY